MIKWIFKHFARISLLFSRYSQIPFKFFFKRKTHIYFKLVCKSRCNCTYIALGPRTFLRGICMFSLSNLASSHSPKPCIWGIGDLADLN